MSFRFETILRLNKKKEDLLQKDMGQINAHYQLQQDRKQFMRDAMEKSKDELNQRKKSGISVETMILYENFSRGTEAEEAKQDKIISEINTRLEAKREEVVEAMRKRRTMEILKERDMLKERKIREKKETAVLDEVASNLWMRNF
ncbi:MAG: flagellar export protein FliJ [Nitrospinae bacterium CG22_combo_CG10-13_8_21_14_all_47_10]|nr:MAG: flagellar export protein FliJ [Nitrospinae bacterium CG22_combo_CG10-13_8_21_14_all_47_10]